MWSIKDDLGIIGKGQVRFAFRPLDRHCPSISLIYGQRSIVRVDLENPEACEFNPSWAAGYGLPPRVCGSHVHRWEDNRDHVASQDEWGLPCRFPLPPQVRKIDQGLGWLAEYANITLDSDQHGFDIPQGIL